VKAGEFQEEELTAALMAPAQYPGCHIQLENCMKHYKVG